MPRNERRSYIGCFSVGSEIYEHVIFTDTDDRVECLDQDGKLILTFTANCLVKMPNNDILGRWNMRGKNWYFTSERDDKEYVYDHDLLEAEMKVSELFIEGVIK